MSFLLTLWRCSFLIIISISEESKPMVNIWRGTKTKFYVERLSFAKHITMLLVTGNNFWFENKEVIKRRSIYVYSEIIEKCYSEKLSWKGILFLYLQIMITNIAQYVIFVTFCILLPNILLANPIRVWSQLMSVKSLKLENWKLC